MSLSQAELQRYTPLPTYTSEQRRTYTAASLGQLCQNGDRRLTYPVQRKQTPPIPALSEPDELCLERSIEVFFNIYS